MKENTKLCSLSSENIIFNKKYKSVALKIVEILHQTKEELGTPGICFAISHHGELVLKGGIGLADVENHVPCTSKTVLRIASISKSLTTLAIGTLIIFFRCVFIIQTIIISIEIEILFKITVYSKLLLNSY